MLDFIRIACVVPAVKVADTEKNAEDICRYIELTDRAGADVVLFPELALTGYTCGDLFFQSTLHSAVKAGVRRIAECSAKHPNITAVFGLPLTIGNQLYNCAAVMARGEVAGIVPKCYIEPSERRWFASGEGLSGIYLEPKDLGLTESEDYWAIPVQADQLFRLGDNAMVGIEICQDSMVPQPRCGRLAVNGAEVILNLSASPERVGKAAYRRELVKHHSCACNCIYAYASAGFTESTSDQVFSGQSVIAENGRILAENMEKTDYFLLTDCDLGRIRADRCRAESYGMPGSGWRETAPYGDALRSDGGLYPLRKLVFVPDGREQRRQRCLEVFDLQVTGLMRRLQVIGAKPVIGISGGLDSTLALLVAAEAVRRLGRPMTDVHGITMPCFGTSDRTYRNAWELMEKLGITAKEISIREAVRLHFQDIGHDPSVHNGTYENSQARERTQILMDYAGSVGGIVVGTGDLSELALGWCTYNGDHMSMYSVNADVPKTLIRWIIDAVTGMEDFSAAAEVLADILDTPISPELLPPDAEGKIAQQTEDLVGPYALHDFFLYHVLRYGFGPKKVYTLACRAFEADFDAATVKKWLVAFYRRFFSQQFKRNCLPDGVKVGAVGLGPRGDWVMPSDAAATLWLAESERL